VYLTLFYSGLRAQENEYVKLSNRFLKYLIEEDFESAYNSCSRDLKNAMSEEELKDLWPSIEKQFGSLSPEALKRLDQMSSEQLIQLGEDLLEAKSISDLGLENGQK